MKIVNIAGGLGNQMFQYAFALGMKEKFNEEEIKIDISTFNGLKIERQYELGTVFDVQLPIATPKDLKKVTRYSRNSKLRKLMRRVFGLKKTEYKEPRLFTFWEDVYSINGDCYYEGSWQNEAYFKDYKSIIKNAFCFKKELDDKNKDILDGIQHTNSVSIHVRRGDYLSIPFYQNICDEPYYRRAISYINENVEKPHFYIFSTDTEWCKENIVPILGAAPFTIIDWNVGLDSYKDMQLMSCCYHNIIAHSSFSWWAAWLNDNESKIVVTPKEWFKRDDITDSPQLKSWIRISNEQ